MFDSLTWWLYLLTTVTAETFVTRITMLDTVIKYIFCCVTVVLPGKLLRLQFVLLYFVATSHITRTITNCFSVDTQYCPCHRGWYLQFFERFITNTWGLGSLQKKENEANLLLPLGIQKLKGFWASGGLCPLTPWPGALPLDPATPVIGSCSALAVSTQHFLTWRRP